MPKPSLPDKQIDNDYYDGLQNFIDSFRKQKEYTDPERWLAYIDLMAISRKSEYIFGLTVQDFLPRPGCSEISKLSVVRRLDVDCKPNRYCALFVHREDYRNSSRLAILIDNSGNYYFRKSRKYQGKIMISRQSTDNELVVKFGDMLIIYLQASEIAHPSSF